MRIYNSKLEHTGDVELYYEENGQRVGVTTLWKKMFGGLSTIELQSFGMLLVQTLQRAYLMGRLDMEEGGIRSESKKIC